MATRLQVLALVRSFILLERQAPRSPSIVVRAAAEPATINRSAATAARRRCSSKRCNSDVYSRIAPAFRPL